MTKETKIIAPAHLHKYIYKTLLQKQQTSMLLGAKVETFEQIQNQNINDPIEEFVNIYQSLQKQSLTQLQTMITYPSFVQQLYDTYQQLYLYHCNLHTLPEATDTEKDIKEIMLFFDTLPLNIKQQVSNIQQFIPDGYQLLDSYTQNLYQQKIYQTWNKQTIPYAIPLCTEPNILIRKAQNHRQEIESIFQYIIRKHYTLSEVQLVLLDPSYIHYIQQLSQRYKMPFEANAFSVPSLYIQKLLAAIEFIETPNNEKLLQLCNQQFFLTNTQELQQYLQLRSCTPQECLTPFTTFQEVTNSYFDITELQEIERQAEIQRQNIVDILDELLHKENIVAKIECAFMYLLNDSLLQDNEEIKAYRKAKNALEILLVNDAPISVILYEIKKIQKERAQVNSEAITISTLDTLLPGYPLTIVVGCSQDNFPNLQEYKGIIDESYLSKVVGFPTMIERAEHYYQQAEKLYHIADTIIFSYSCSNLQGKAFELSIEVEKRFHVAVEAWDLTQLPYNDPIFHNISDTIAKQLFLNANNKLTGSVSTLEQYQNCNYAYFLNKGLGIKEPVTLEMDHRIMGTIQHAIVEYFVKEDKGITRMDVEQFLSPLFANVLPLFPQKQDYVFILQQQLVERFTQRLQDIQKSVQEGIMKPAYFEKYVNYTMDVKPYPIELRGIIDRIDTSEDYFRIIDYKSSKKELHDAKFEAGLQLQLITYMLVACELLQKRPYGAFYQSVKIENTDVLVCGSKDKETKQYMPITDAFLQENYRKNNVAKGWRVETLDQPEFAQDDYFHYKDKDFVTLKERLLSIYADISQNITNGQIAPNPTENTCGYCPYKSICRYHGETRKFTSRGGVSEDA